MRPLPAAARYIPVALLFLLASPPHHPATTAFVRRVLRLSPRPRARHVAASPPHLRARAAAPARDLDLGELQLTRARAQLRYAPLLVAPGASLRAAPRAPRCCTARAPCAVLVEAWYDAALFREAKPDPFLRARRAREPTPLLRRGERALIAYARRQGRERDLHARKTHPAGLSDLEAFLTWRPYHYLLLRNVTWDDDWHLRILNHNGTVINPLNATLRITLAPPPVHSPPDTPGDVLCPRGPTERNCSGHGECVRGECQCHHGHEGRYCEGTVHNFTNDAFDVPPEQMMYFRYVVPRNGTVAVVLFLRTAASASSGSQPIVFAKRLHENGGRLLSQGPPLPSTYDLRFTDKAGFLGGLPTQKVVRTSLVEGEVLYIGVYNFHRLPPLWLMRQRPHFGQGGLSSPHFSVRVRMEVFPCVDRRMERFQDRATESLLAKKKLRYCPPRSGQEQWEIGVTFLLLPFLLVTLTLLTVVVCVSVWASVFRRQLFEVIHGHPPEEAGSGSARRDKLSETEVNAMFPSFVFTKGETAALGATGDVCCSVCLCSFEEGDMLRRLACGHSYHSTCLDQWLLTNATCPRCRKSARINGEATRYSWFSRRVFSRVFGRIRFPTRLLPPFLQPRGRDVGLYETVETEEFLSESDFSRRFGPGP